MYKNFEDYLKDRHAKGYHGTDDDMPDAYEDWLTNMDIEVMVAHGDLFGAIRAKEAVEDLGKQLNLK